VIAPDRDDDYGFADRNFARRVEDGEKVEAVFKEGIRHALSQAIGARAGGHSLSEIISLPK
jgi:hypothetical protein